MRSGSPRLRLARRVWPTLACAAVACGGPPGRPGEETASSRDALQQCVSASVEGVDVSDGQGTIDWASVKAAGVDFALMKATQGTYDTQKTFAANWAGAQAAGLYRSPYHFFDPTADGAAQAQHFLAVVGPFAPDDLPAMLDIECPTGSADTTCLGTGTSDAASATDIATRMWAFIHAVEQATGKRPLIYTYGSYFASNGIDTTGLDAYPLYIADPVTGSCFSVPSPWSSAVLWQYSFTGSVSGISDAVDRDKFIGTLADLQQLAQSGGNALAEVNGNDTMSLVNWPSDGHVELYATTTTGIAIHVYTNPGTDTWTRVYDYPGAATCGVASAMWPMSATGAYAQLFDPTAAGSTQELSFAEAGWTPFANFGGGPLTHLSTAVGLDGHVEVYGLTANGAMEANAWDSSTSAWSGWQSLGGAELVTGAAPIVWNDGHIELFALGANGAAWHDSAANGGWSGWESMGGHLASRPVPARWADGHVEVYARGLDGHTWSSSWNQTWPPFTAIETATELAGQITVLVNPGGAGATRGPELFARLADGAVGETAWNGTAWPPWSALGAQSAASDPQAWVRADGTGQVFAVGPDGSLVQNHRDSSGAWDGWATIAPGIAPCAEPPVLAPDAEGGTGDVGSNEGGTDAGEEAPRLGAASSAANGCGCRAEGSSSTAGSFTAGNWLASAALALVARSFRRHSRERVLAGRSKETPCRRPTSAKG
jgi:GH25 family lysozyme M1 (1,4-beta-N-acetylmuramidase)